MFNKWSRSDFSLSKASLIELIYSSTASSADCWTSSDVELKLNLWDDISWRFCCCVLYWLFFSARSLSNDAFFWASPALFTEKLFNLFSISSISVARLFSEILAASSCALIIAWYNSSTLSINRVVSPVASLYAKAVPNPASCNALIELADKCPNSFCSSIAFSIVDCPESSFSISVLCFSSSSLTFEILSAYSLVSSSAYSSILIYKS